MRLLVWCLILAAGASAGCVGSSSHNSSGSEFAGVPARAVETWEKIRALETPMEYHEYDLTYGYWLTLMVDGEAILVEYLNEGFDEKGLEFIVDQFGRHGAQADMRLMLACGRLMLPDQVQLEASDDAIQRALGTSAANWRRASDIVCRFQIRRLMADEALRTRYYRFAVWSKMFIAPDVLKLHGHVVRTNPDVQSRGYWWHARSFLLLAHATGSLDLLRAGSPDEWGRIYPFWRSWFFEEGDKLVFDTPSLTWRLPVDGPNCYNAEERKAQREWLTRGYHQGHLIAWPFEDWQGVPPPDHQLLPVGLENAYAVTD